MRRIVLLAAVGATAAATVGAASAAPSANGVTHANNRVCATPATGYAACNAIRHDTYVNGKPAPTAATGLPAGYGTSDLRSAYQLTATGSPAGVVAIVDAYDDPNAAADLNTYRAKYGLPAVNNGGPTFKKYNQSGVQGSYPRSNGGWAQEISLDLDMVSAICPNCSIALVEASSSSMANLATAEDTAAGLSGVVAISNSYGGSEYSGEVNDQSHYNHSGIAITVSSGDNGYGVQFPAASRYVTAVGGTSLTGSIATGWSETAWSGAGSGCSAYVTKPSWQTDSGCAKRTVADVSADADPNTGVAVYDSLRYQGMSGWMVFGGTSVASPIVASVYALKGSNLAPSGVYAAPSGSLNDITSGSNGSCGVTYLCTAVPGYDGPTGLGTPNGTGAF